MDDPKVIVEQGYDRVAERYAAWTGESWTGTRARYGSLLLERLPAGATLLELGCGTGIPATREFARHFTVTGVDISGRSIELARQNVPGATFLHADMGTLDFPPASFDAIVAFLSIIHLPRKEHAPLLHCIAAWLRPGGLLVATMGAGESDDGYEETGWAHRCIGATSTARPTSGSSLRRALTWSWPTKKPRTKMACR